MNIDSIVSGLSKEQLNKISRFAYWGNILGNNVPYSATECGSCGSFCSGGACTTASTNFTYLQDSKKYKN